MHQQTTSLGPYMGQSHTPFVYAISGCLSTGAQLGLPEPKPPGSSQKSSLTPVRKHHQNQIHE